MWNKDVENEPMLDLSIDRSDRIKAEKAFSTRVEISLMPLSSLGVGSAAVFRPRQSSGLIIRSYSVCRTPLRIGTLEIANSNLHHITFDP